MGYYSSIESARAAHKPKIVRMILGIFVGFIVPCVSLALCVLSYAFYVRVISTVRWLDWIIIVFLTLLAVSFLFYSYGWMHWSFIAFTAHANVMFRIFGKIVGGIGYVLQPIVLLAYGANKKWIYALAVAVPGLLCGTVFLLNTMGIFKFEYIVNFQGLVLSLRTFSLPITVVSYLNAFLALLTKRCKVCGSMMTIIESALSERQYQEHGGYYDSSAMGEYYKVGKYYVCDHCGNVKKGVGFSVQTN